MLCCWIENPNSDAFKRHLARVADFLWVGEDGMKVRVNVTCFRTAVFVRQNIRSLQICISVTLSNCNVCSKLILHVNVHSKVCAGQLWDVAFAIQAILACNIAEEFGSTLKKAHDFLKASQVLFSRIEVLLVIFLLTYCLILLTYILRLWTILLVSSAESTVTYQKVDGPSRLQIRVGRFQIAQQKLLRCAIKIKHAKK